MLRTFIAATLAAFAGCASADGGGLHIYPIQQQFKAGETVKAYRFQNNTGGPRTLKFQAARVEPGGAQTPTRELLAYPPVLRLEPGATAQVKLAARAGKIEEGRLYKLYVEAESDDPAPSSASGAWINMRLALPVILHPQSPSRSLVADGRKVCNRGNVPERLTGQPDGGLLGYALPGECIAAPESVQEVSNGETTIRLGEAR